MPIDVRKLLQTGLNVGSQLLPRLTTQGLRVGGLTIPNQLAGAGALLGGSLLDKEPGEVLEARQAVRNLLTPESQTGQFTGFVKGFQEQFQPALTQQRQLDIADIGRRFAAAFPGTVGAQGPEFGGLSRYITEQALPREQAFLGQLGLEGIRNQLSAGDILLRNARPDPFAQALSQFGSLLLARDLFGGGGQGGGASQLGFGTDGASLLGPGGSSLLDQAGNVLGTIGADGGLTPSVSQLLAGNVTPDMIARAGQLFQAGVPFGRPAGVQGPLLPGGGFFSGTAALARPPGVQGPLLESGQFFSGTGGASAGPSGLATAAGAVGTAVAGYQIGQAVGRQFKGGADTSGTRAKGGVSGAASGAAAGAAIGSVIPGIGTAVGAVIGAIAGGIGGARGSSKAEKARKEASIQFEAQSTGERRPQAERWLAQLDENARQFPQMKALADQIEPQVQALIDANDPAIRSVIDQTRAFYRELGKGGFTTSTGVPLPDAQQQTPPASALLSRLVGDAFNTNQGVEVNRQNPESVVGRIFSSETGKFDSAFDVLQKSVQNVARLQQLWQQLLQRVGGG